MMVLSDDMQVRYIIIWMVHHLMLCGRSRHQVKCINPLSTLLLHHRKKWLQRCVFDTIVIICMKLTFIQKQTMFSAALESASREDMHDGHDVHVTSINNGNYPPSNESSTDDLIKKIIHMSLPNQRQVKQHRSHNSSFNTAIGLPKIPLLQRLLRMVMVEQNLYHLMQRHVVTCQRSR